MSHGAVASSPAGRSVPPSTPGSKRKISPTNQRSGSLYEFEAFLRTPPPQSGGHVDVMDVSHTHAHPPPSHDQKGVQDKKKELWHAKHILLDFNLRDENIDVSRGEYQEMLRGIFPKTENVTIWGGDQLVFQVREMPKGPWPVSIGGMPFTMSTLDGKEGRGPIFPRALSGKLSVRICEQGYDTTKFTDGILRKLAAEVHSYFVKNVPRTNMKELMWNGRCFYVIVDSLTGVSHEKLPGKICRRWAEYIVERELNRPAGLDLSAKRLTQPRPHLGIIDTSTYEILRPGVMIGSLALRDHGHPACWETTSGVLVKNPAGDTFMTVASHGVGDDLKVWQGTRRDKVIGTAVAEISFTDVSLVELKPEVQFINETFEDDHGNIPAFTRLRNSNDNLRLYDACYLNSAYTGNLEAQIIAATIRVEASAHPTDSMLRYVVYHWRYEGQVEGNTESYEPPDGTCGSAIWTDDGVILGFYHFFIHDGPYRGFSASVSASEVVESGYQLA